MLQPCLFHVPPQSDKSNQRTDDENGDSVHKFSHKIAVVRFIVQVTVNVKVKAKIIILNAMVGGRKAPPFPNHKVDGGKCHQDEVVAAMQPPCRADDAPRLHRAILLQVTTAHADGLHRGAQRMHRQQRSQHQRDDFNRRVRFGVEENVEEVLGTRKADSRGDHGDGDGGSLGDVAFAFANDCAFAVTGCRRIGGIHHVGMFDHPKAEILGELFHQGCHDEGIQEGLEDDLENDEDKNVCPNSASSAPCVACYRSIREDEERTNRSCQQNDGGGDDGCNGLVCK
mmetsp:Transcript_22736/g.63440  ORF Transcript_22736/g.63440 Transcript_22736/m.63440 type:complete len:284 (-) Transcript_22736:300-1151(-)